MDEARQHTDREYELEQELFELYSDIQGYFIAVSMNDKIALKSTVTRLREKLTRWRDNTGDYMQHPKWNEAVEDVMDDLAESEG